jgi:hypothetical protein
MYLLYPTANGSWYRPIVFNVVLDRLVDPAFGYRELD